MKFFSHFMLRFALRNRLAAVLSITSLLAPSLAYAAEGYLYTSDFFGTSVSVVNTLSKEVDAVINAGSSPDGIALYGTGAYVTVANDDVVAVIDTTTNTIDFTIDVGDQPRAIAISGTGAFVSNGGDNSVSVIDLTTHTVDATIVVGNNPRAIAISGTGAFVTNASAASVSVIDITTLTVDATVSVGTGPRAITISGTGAFVANGVSDNVSVIDITTNTVDLTINVGDGPEGAAATGTGVFIANNSADTVSVIDTTTHTVDAVITVGDGPYGIVFVNTGAYVSNYSSEDISLIDITTNTVEETIDVGNGAFSIAFLEDDTTRDPTLTAPTSGASVQLCNDLTITYTLPETPLSGSVKLKLYNEGTHVTVTATLNNSTGATFSLDLESITSVANVVSSTATSITTGSYTVYLEYQDQFGNAVADFENNDLTVTACASSSSSSSVSSSSSSTPSGGGGRRGSPGRCEASGTCSSSSSATHAAAPESSSSQSSVSAKSVTDEICEQVEDVSNFKDVRDNAWFSCYSKNVAGLKIFEGYKDTDGTPKNEFGPSDNITLGQLAKVGTILRNKEDLNPKPTGDKWYEPYIGAAQAYDAYVFGGVFDPVAPASRDQVILTILEALQIPLIGEESPYSDVPESTMFWQPIVTATKLGIVSGDPGTTNFRPNDPVNRAEVAKMLSLALAHVGIIYGDEMPEEETSSSSISSSSESSSSSIASSESSDSSDASSTSSETSESSSESSEPSESLSSSQSSVAMMVCTNLLPRVLIARTAPKSAEQSERVLMPHQSDLCTPDIPGWVKLSGGNGQIEAYLERNGAISVKPLN